ncbi:MAG TPA: Eco57I restriction-modification methylase domain-containing protein [Pirellulales bacterium]|nr:Eco57I restriction-modification methylase domain-containing protein [Pirellulales bacterium]
MENNLYGVDLNEEAIEICRLSLWIKTAERGKVLTSLDHTIRVGNSVVSDPAEHEKAFDWHAEFPEVFGEVRSAQGGFDVVVGNPPYVRQELLSDIKPYLQREYRSYHGMADLYVYFYERGLRLLRPGGLLSMIVTNKWMKSGYGEPLRRFFAESAWIESVVDFGHAKQIFEDADVFPSIIVARKPTAVPKPKTAKLCVIPREQLRIDDLSRQIEHDGVALPLNQLGADTWQLEPSGVTALLEKIRRNGAPLAEYAGTRPYRGVVTGFNDAFLIDGKIRNALLADDPKCSEIILPYLRGQDIDRWASDWVGLWMIFARRGIEIDAYPSVKAHLSRFKKQLEPKPADWVGDRWPGRKPGTYRWFEIQDSIDYWREFAKPKIMYQDIAWRAQFCVDRRGMMGNNTIHFLPSDDSWILAVLNSPIAWWFSWRSAQHGKDEALRLFTAYVEQFRIPSATAAQRDEAMVASNRLIQICEQRQSVRRTLLDWLRVEHEIEKPSQKLQSPFDLDSDAFVSEVKKARARKNPLSAAGLRSLRDEHERTIEPARRLAAEALSLEHCLSDLVNAAYGLTPDEVALMWSTAPPRMPFTVGSGT